MDPALWIELAVFVVLLVFSGFFSSTETALFSLSSFHLDQMRKAKNPRIDLIERLRSEPRRLIVTILIGNEFVNVAASVISAAVIIKLFGAENDMLNLLVMVPILLLFGEITPKVLAIRNNMAFASFQARPIHLFARLITPLREVIRHVAEFFITLIVGKQRSQGNLVTEDMIRTLVTDAVGEGALDSQEARYIEKIFDFGNKSLRDIMRPRSDIEFLSADLSVPELIARSRLPVSRAIPFIASGGIPSSASCTRVICSVSTSAGWSATRMLFASSCGSRTSSLSPSRRSSCSIPSASANSRSR
jgi:putative hemolysin